MRSPLHKEVLWLPRWGVSHGCALTANAVSLPRASLQLRQSMAAPSSTSCLARWSRQEHGILWDLLEFNRYSPINISMKRSTAWSTPCAFLPSAPAGMLSHPLALLPLLGSSCSPSMNASKGGRNPAQQVCYSSATHENWASKSDSFGRGCSVTTRVLWLCQTQAHWESCK